MSNPIRPFFCPECSRIRGTPETQRTLLVFHESLMYDSFEMCSACYYLQKNHPEEVKANIEKYDTAKRLVEEQKKAEEDAKQFQVFFVDTKFSSVKFINNITKPYEFGSVELERDGFERVKKLKKKVNEEVAKQLYDLITSKELKVWYERIEH